MARLGGSGHGTARASTTRAAQGAELVSAFDAAARSGAARQGLARLGRASHGMGLYEASAQGARVSIRAFDAAWLGRAGRERGLACRGMAWRGKARLGAVWLA
jgi:hypothetical protein